jgi:PRTRC genetic system protein E
MFFEKMNSLLTEGVDLNLTIKKSGEELIVGVLPKVTDLKDEAAQKMVPLVVKGTPGELDAEFVETISAPIAKATGILAGMDEFEKAADAASKNSKASKAEKDKEKKEADAKKKRFDQLSKKADELEKGKKYLNSIACLKQMLQYVTNKQAVEARIKKLEALAGENSLFGEMDTEEPVREDYLEEDTEEEDNEPNEEEED